MPTLLRDVGTAPGHVTRRILGIPLMAQLPTFTMPFQPTTIKHLGLRLYSTLPPVISELVSNAYDAESGKVEITVPEGAITNKSEVIVKDWGHGLSASELQHEYLPIGRNRRGPDSSAVKSKNAKRLVTGRKGLGKLSAFGIAEEVEVRSVQTKKAICLRINLDKMLEWAREHAPDRPYEPEVVEGRSGLTSDDDGVEVILRGLRRKTQISQEELRRGLARRLHIIKAGFSVTVNGVSISSKDRVRRSDCADGFVWGVTTIPGKGHVAKGCLCDGWIGFTESSSQIGRGVNIIAHGKAVELGSFFNLPTTHAQFARAHLVGEVTADFLDEDEDLVGTARNSVVWESDVGEALELWGQNALKWLFQKWLEERKRAKEEKIIKTAGFDKWLESRPIREQNTAKRMVRLLIDDPKIETESAVPLFEIVKSSVETVYFQELVEALESQGSQASVLLSLFDEWRIIEARSHLKLADGRAEAMRKLAAFMDRGALEVQEIQPLLQEHLWLLNPKWTEADGQTTYTDMLRKSRACKEPKEYSDKERRLDILGVKTGDSMTVTEIKRPDKTLSRKDLEQVARYVDWARNQFEGSGAHAPKYIDGLLVVGNLSNAGDVQRVLTRLAGDDIRVETYRDLYEAAKEYYGEAEKYLKTIAPEYARSRRQGGSAKAAEVKKKRQSDSRKKTAAKTKAKAIKKKTKKKASKKKAKKKG